MNYYIFNKRIVGYKHKLKNKLCQDYCLYEKLDKGILVTIADGHSGDYFIFSHRGAKLACRAFIDVMKNYINNNEDNFFSMSQLLCKKVIQREIYNEWRKLVFNDFFSIIPRVYKIDYFRYGTTLLGMYINEDYKLFIRLGDGEILTRKNYTFEKVFATNRKLFVDTMSQKNSFNKIEYKISKTNKNNDMPIVMYSDGYENSFKSYKDMVKDINDTIYKYENNVFTRMNLKKNYCEYLDNLSKNGSKDDITICFVNKL